MKTIAMTPSSEVAIVFIRSRRARLSSAPAKVTTAILRLLRGAFRGRRLGLRRLEHVDELVHVVVLLFDELHGERGVQLADLRDDGRDVAQALRARQLARGVGEE